MTFCLAVGLEAIVSGLATGWTSPYLAQLTSAEMDMPLRLTDAEASWVASFLNIGRLIGALFGAFCQGKSPSLQLFANGKRFIDQKFLKIYEDESR